MSEQQWYYALNGQQAGPVSWENLLTELRMGRIQPSTQVWSAHLPGWTPLAECLKAQGGPPPLPPPSPAPTPFPAPIQRPAQGLLPVAPGASAAKTTGILSLIFAFLCLPVGIVLAIVALVQHSKAKTAYSLSPGSYQPVSSVGRTTAIIGLVLPVLLFFIGLVSAIAIPALLGQRGRARDKASIATMTTAIADLAGESDKQRELGVPVERLSAQLEVKLRALGSTTLNPWDTSTPAFTYTVQVVRAGDSSVAADQARGLAADKGRSVFVLALPDAINNRPGYLAGAVRLETPVNGSRVFTKVIELD